MSPKKHFAPLAMRNIRFLTNDLSYVDGRPVYTKDGKHIVFMRQENNGDPNAISSLYIVKADGSGKPELLFNGINPKTGTQFNATRPDISWERKNYQLVFDAVDDGIWLLDMKTKKVKQVLEPEINNQHYIWSYPAWHECGKHINVTNYNSYSASSNAYHQIVKAKVDDLNKFEIITDNNLVWPGMSSVSLKDPKYITFAGQIPIIPQPPAEPCSCANGGQCDPDGYAQNCNQIWIQYDHSTPFQIDGEQGRAPWFSPHGKYIVFESNRANPELINDYRLFVYDVKHKTVEVITPAGLNVQHGKWSPHAKYVTFAVQLFGGAQGIALIELGEGK